jgi:four helix bundle protein
VKSYRDLRVWQDGVDFVAVVYRATESFPTREQYGLTSQLRRSAVSIPANVAEGHARMSTREYLRFVSISLGSLAETETHITVARKLGYLSTEQERPLLATCDALSRMLHGLCKSLQTKIKNQRKD